MSFFLERSLSEHGPRTIQALLVHADQDDRVSATRYILTSHRIEHTPTGPLIAEGRLLTPTDQRALIEALLGALSGSESAYLPPEVLAYSAAQLAWFIPSRIAPMWFRVGANCLSYTVPWPALVFRVNSRGLAIAALSGSRRPRARTRLFHAPLMNVYADSMLCAGNSPLPPTWTLADRAAYENVVFATNFSHVNHERTLRTASNAKITTAAHVRFWRALHTAKAKQFPKLALRPLGHTIETWLSLK
jgi:PRTRC genetic system protein B